MSTVKLGLEVTKALSEAVVPAIRSAAGQATRALTTALSSEPFRAIEAQAAQQAAALFATSVFQAANGGASTAHAPEAAGQQTHTPGSEPESAIVPYAHSGPRPTPEPESRIVPYAAAQTDNRPVPHGGFGALLSGVSTSVATELGGILIDRLSSRSSAPDSALVPFSRPGPGPAPEPESRIAPYAAAPSDTAPTLPGELGALTSRVSTPVTAEHGRPATGHLSMPSSGPATRPSETGAPLPLTSGVFGEVAGGLMTSAPKRHHQHAGRIDPGVSTGHVPGETQTSGNNGATAGPAPAGAGASSTPPATNTQDNRPNVPSASTPEPQNAGARPEGQPPHTPQGPSSPGDTKHQPASEKTSASATGKSRPTTVEEAQEHVLREQERMLIEDMMRQLERARKNMEVHEMIDSMADRLGQLKDIQQKLGNAAGY